MRSPSMLVPLCVGVWACGGDAAPTPGVVVRDSAGVMLVENRAPAMRGADAPGIGDVVVRIGGEGTELNRVAGAARLADGRLVVADEGDRTLKMFDADGAPLGRVGRAGDGPGEFRTIQAMGVHAADTVWVFDFTHARVTLVGPDAAPRREFTLRPPLNAGLAVGPLPGGGFLVGEAWSPSLATAEDGGLVRGRVAYVRFAADGALVDTVAVTAGREVLLTTEAGRGVMSAVPFARGSSHTVLQSAPDDALSSASPAFVVGDQVSHELRFFSAEGALSRIVRWDGGDLELDDDWMGRWRESRLADADPEEREAIERALAEVPLPPSRPAYGPLLPTPDGGLWVGAYALPGHSPRSWEVLDRHGAWVATIAAPDRFEPLWLGRGQVVGVYRDEYDVEHVEVRTLR